MTVEITTGTGVTAAQLGRMLSITARRVRQLRDEGAFRELPAGGFDPTECAGALHVVRSGRGTPAMRAVFREAEEVSVTVERGLARLSKLPQERRLDVAMSGIGPMVGRLIHLLSLAAACAPEGARRDFERGHVAVLQAQLLGALLAAVGAEVEPEIAP